MIATILSAVLPFFVFILLSILFFHFKHSLRPMVTMTKVWILCTPLVVVASNFLNNFAVNELIPIKLQIMLYVLLLFIFLYYLYLQVFALITLSISLRLLSHIALAPDQTIRLEELEKLYPFDELLKLKLDQAVKAGIIESTSIENNVYYSNKTLSNKLALMFLKIKQFLNWGEGG